MTHIGLFAGIGGFELAAKWMGWETLAWCELNCFLQQALKYYFPNAEGFGDIKKTDFKKYANKIDILTGGFPCQPYSLAGERKGKEDERHLWPEMLRAIKEIRPRWIVGENVFGIINWSKGLVFHEVQADLEAAGYEVWTYVLPACAVNAPHRRDRVWFIAHACGSGRVQHGRSVPDRDRDSEEQKQRRQQQPDGFGRRCENWIPAYSYSNGSHGTKNRQGNSKRVDSNQAGQNSIIKFERCSNKTTRKNVAHIQSIRCEQSGYSWSRWTGFANNNSDEISSDTQCIRQQRSWRPEGCSSKKTIGDWKASWSYTDGRWPLESPLCSRDDGLSSRLARITVPSKKYGTRKLNAKQTLGLHRQESLKGYGNAVVPQEVFEIYKSIQQYEDLLTDTTNEK